MAVNRYVFSCQVTACDAKFRTLRSLVSHMNLRHSSDKRLGLYCIIQLELFAAMLLISTKVIGRTRMSQLLALL